VKILLNVLIAVADVGGPLSSIYSLQIPKERSRIHFAFLLSPNNMFVISSIDNF
jgi:hypothetical protein